MSRCRIKPGAASVSIALLLLLMCAGGLLAATTPLPADADLPPAMDTVDREDRDSSAEPVVLEETYASIEFDGTDDLQPLGAFVGNLGPGDATTHDGLGTPVELLSGDETFAAGEHEQSVLAFLSASTQRQADRTFVIPASAKPAGQNEIIPPPSPLWSGIILIAGVLIYRLHRKILYLC